MASPSHSRTIKREEETKQNRGISPPTRFIPWFTQEQCPSGQERQIFNADLRHNQVWSKKGGLQWGPQGPQEVFNSTQWPQTARLVMVSPLELRAFTEPALLAQRYRHSTQKTEVTGPFPQCASCTEWNHYNEIKQRHSQIFKTLS